MSKINFVPLDNRVLIDRKDEERTSPGGIVIPDTAAEKPAQGAVVAVGPGKQLDNGTKTPMSVKVGDTVLFGKYAGTEVKLDGKDYIVMHENDIMGIIK